MYKNTYDAEGNHLHQIEFYRTFEDWEKLNTNTYTSLIINGPDGNKMTYTGRLEAIKDEATLYFPTVIVDSASSLELLARKYSEVEKNPDWKDGRKHHGESTSAQENIIYFTKGMWPRNVITICHVDNTYVESEGVMVRQYSVKGRLKTSISSAYTEIYRAYREKDVNGEWHYRLQTNVNDQYSASTMIDAPDGCAPNYTALWGDSPIDPNSVMHLLLYGPAGVGKSTCAASWPHPGLVLCFDAPGKEMPYVKYALDRGGRVEEGGG